MTQLTVGQVIKGYELQELVGEGGFGAVYRALQPLVGREVAIKIILPQHANRPEFIRRFESEAQLVARLEHPFIVPLYDYWRDPDGAFLVMRWLRGGNLSAEIKKNGPFDPQRVSKILSQIGEALAVAHRQGVIHRDLKLDNILLDENGNAFLTDFGIAKDLGLSQNITKNNAILGSPAYLSPEQIKGETVNPQADIYSLGIAVFHMLTGNLPFNEETPAAMMYKHLSEPMPDISEVKSGISPMINLVLQKATSKEKDDRYQDILSFVKDFRRALRADENTADDEFESSDTALNVLSTASLILPEPENPYKGLRAFQQADATDFYGREILTDQLVTHFTEPENRFLAVIGPSGSGKSSVVKAGVIPSLKRDAIPGSKNWFIVEMVPSIEPLEELEAALLRIAVNPPESLLTQLNEDERGLVRAVKRVLPDDDTEILLVIDQFEEVFTLVDEEEIRVHFLNSLLTAANDERSRIRIIITLRADFYDKPLNYVGFGDLLRRNTEVVLPLSEDELKRAITEPTKRVGMTVEPALVKAIISDVSSQPGALPLLQYALTELFERQEARSLTLKAYEEIGGTLGALARRATELYEGLDEDAQDAARQVFLRLVTLGEGTEDTRRRVFRSELLSIGEDDLIMADILDAFGRYRLLTFDHDPQTRNATVEIAHEALIRQWNHLREWLTDSREDLRNQRRLMAAAEEWLRGNKDQSFLLRGARLTQFEEWSEQTSLSLNDEEADYLKASVSARKAREAEEVARQQREEELEKRSRDRLRALVGVMSVAAIIALGLFFIAFTQSQQAQEARDEAQHNADEARSLALAANARNALIEDDPALALSLALEADAAFDPAPVEVVRVLSTAAFGENIRHRLEGHEGSVLTANFSQDGTLTVSGSADGTARIWNNITGEEIQVISLPNDIIITSVVFNLDASAVFTATTDSIIYMWDVESGNEIRRFEGHNEAVTSLDISTDGTQLLSGSLDHTLRLWDVETAEMVQEFIGHTGTILDVGLSENGLYAVSSSGDETLANTTTDEEDRTVRVWDLRTGTELQRFTPPPGFVRAVDISPDNLTVVAGTWNNDTGGTLSIWNIRTGRLEQRFYGHSDIITGITFSPDGNTIYSTSWDRTLRVWDVGTGIEVDRFENFDDRALNVSISNDGEFILVPTGDLGGNEITVDSENAKDTSVWLIDLKNRDEIRRFDGVDDWFWTLDVSPDEQTIATGHGPLFTPTDATPTDTLVRIWDIETGEVIATFDGHTETVEGVAFSPDGTQLLSSAWDGRIILWDVDSGDIIQTFTIPEEDVDFTSVDFHADGERFISGTTAGFIILWNLNGEEIRRFEGHTRDTDYAVFSPDGTQIASASYDGTVRIWDVETGEMLHVLEGHLDRVNDVAFSPDGSQVVSSSWDATLRLWDVESGELLRTIVGHNGNTFGVQFSPDGKHIVSGSSDATIRLWEIETGQELLRLSGHTDWISEVELLNNGSYVFSGGQDNTMRLWQIPLNTQAIFDWATENRYVGELSCAEREQFRVEPLCEVEDSDS